jgi:hypothetical protein
MTCNEIDTRYRARYNDIAYFNWYLGELFLMINIAYIAWHFKINYIYIRNQCNIFENPKSYTKGMNKKVTVNL